MLPQPEKFRYRPVRAEHVIEFVVQAAEGVGSAAVVALAGVVEDDVEDDLDAGGVKGPDHVAELVDLAVLAAAGGVGRLGRREGDAVVAPEVPQPLAGLRVGEGTIVLVELVDRQQFDGGDAQLFQIGDLLDQPGKVPGLRDAGGGMAGEAADVQLVDDRVFQARSAAGRPLPSRSGPAVIERCGGWCGRIGSWD